MTIFWLEPKRTYMPGADLAWPESAPVLRTSENSASKHEFKKSFFFCKSSILLSTQDPPPKKKKSFRVDVVALCAGISTLSATRIISHSRPAARILWHTTTTTSLGHALCLFLHSDYTTDGLQQLSFTNILSGSVAERQFVNMGSGSNFFSSSEIKIDSQCCGSEASWVFFAGAGLKVRLRSGWEKGKRAAAQWYTYIFCCYWFQSLKST